MRSASSCSAFSRDAAPASSPEPSARSCSIMPSPSSAFSIVTREQSLMAFSHPRCSSSFSAASTSIFPAAKSGCEIFSPNLPPCGPRCSFSTLQPPSGMMPLGLVSKKVCVGLPDT